MSEHLLKAGANIARRDGDELARLPYLSLWFRTKSAIVLHLTNGTVQINFFQVSRKPHQSIVLHLTRQFVKELICITCAHAHIVTRLPVRTTPS